MPAGTSPGKRCLSVLPSGDTLSFHDGPGGEMGAWDPWSGALASWRASGNIQETEGHRRGTEPQPCFVGRGSELLRGPRGSWAFAWNVEWTGVHAGPERQLALPAWGGGGALGGARCLQDGDDSGQREGLGDLPRSSNFIPRTVGSTEGF